MANGNGDLGERIAALEVNMQIALNGVSNFRQFQVDARKFFERHEERELAREQADALKKEQEEKKDRRRAAIHYWWLGLLSALIVAGFTVVLTQFFQLKAEHHISETQQQSTSYIPQSATDKFYHLGGN